MLRLILTQLLRGLLYLVFIGVCVEVGLQGFYYVTAGDFLFRRVGLPIYAREPYAGFGNRPGLSFDHRTNEFHARYYINQAGFRVPRPNVEYTLAKPSNTYRIMILGPSFAFGWGVDYELSFAGVLQQLLQERGFAGEKKIEIINAGVPAMPVAPQLTWFERVGKDYAPDLVIQFVYGSMAIPNISEPQRPLTTRLSRLARHRCGPAVAREIKKICDRFLRMGVVDKPQYWLAGTPRRARRRRIGSRTRDAAPTDFEPTHPEVREAMHVYNKLASIVRQTGARLLVVYFPLSYAIHREDESRWRHLGILDIPRQMAFDAAFVRYLNERQIPSIDITPAVAEIRASREADVLLARHPLDTRRQCCGGASRR